MKNIRKIKEAKGVIRMQLRQLLALPMLLLMLPGISLAQSTLYPEFMFVESAYVEQPAAGSEETVAYFSILNLHSEDPLVLLSIQSEMFEGATVYDADNNMLEQVVINPGESVEGIRAVFSGVDSTVTAGSEPEINFLIRRGLIALPPVDAIRGSEGAFSGGIKAREAGVPNEDEYLVNFEVRN